MSDYYELDAPPMYTWYDKMMNALVKDIEEKIKMDEKRVPEIVMVPESLASINNGPSIDDLIKFCDNKREAYIGKARILLNDYNFKYESSEVTLQLDIASYYGQIITKLEDLKSYKEKEESKDFEKDSNTCEDSDKIESSIKPGDINNDLDLKIREAEDEATIAEQLSRSEFCPNPIYWEKNAREKRQIVQWLKELKKYKEDEEQNKPARWEIKIVRGTPTPCCSNCFADTIYETRFCGSCGKRMENGVC